MLEARNVSFSFKRGRPLLRDVSLAVEPGTFTAITPFAGAPISMLLLFRGVSR